MDEKDVRIFCDIAFRDLSYNASTQRHVSPSEIGRKLGLDEKTVRSRIKKMEDEGFIKFYQAIPSPSLLGLSHLSLHRFEAMNIVTKQKIIQGVQQTPNILEVLDYIGPTVSIDIAGTSPEQVQKTADGIAARFELTKSNLGMREARDPGVKTERLDWQLIQKLRFDARMSTSELAESLRITPRMAEYRTDKLLDAGALLIRAVINTQRQEGLVFFELELSIDPPARGRVVDGLQRKYGEKLWSVKSPSPNLLLANMFGFTLGEPEEAALDAHGYSGVKYCHLLILKEALEPLRPNWVDAIIEERVDAKLL